MRNLLAFLLLASVPGAGGYAAMIRQSLPAASQLQREIRRELLLLPSYTIFDKLTFELNGTTVHLTGAVAHRELKNAAERVVKEIPGVRQVVNNIEVLSSTALDDQIRLAAFRAIYSDPQFNSRASQAVAPIHLLVNNGCLTLEGTVADEAERKAVYDKALTVPGVLTVSNHLRVTG